MPTVTASAPPAGEAARGPARRSAARWVALCVAAALVGGCALVGLWLTRRGTDLHLRSTYPLHGRYQPHLGWWLTPAMAVGVAAVWFGPAVAGRMPWRWLLVVGYATACGWAVALAAVAGPAAIAAPLEAPTEYLAEVDRINATGVREFLTTFTDHIVAAPDQFGWTTHVAGHPPLASLAFALLARAGLAGSGWAAALCITVGATVAISVLATVRMLAGERLARRAAPFVAVAPAALWVATSADALFAGVAAAGICALAAAARPASPAGRLGRRTIALAAAGGLALGGCLMLSYGLALLAPIALAVVVAAAGWRPAATVIAVAAAAALAVLAGFAVAGFWWPDGFARTADRVMLGHGSQDRPAAYFLFANPAALAVTIGPAVVAALPLLAGLRVGSAARRLAAPTIGALLAIALAVATNLSKGEVERIYLPFVVWLLPAAALLPHDGDGPVRGWLAGQVGWTLLVAATTSLTW